MFPNYRLNANWCLLEKHEPYRDAFLYEKASKTDIYATRFPLVTVFSRRDHANDFLELICFKIVAERFAFLK